MSRFKNPPIVEAWIAFDFNPKPDKVSWEDDAQRFRQASMKEFPQAQFVFTSEMEVEERSDGSVPVVKNHQTKLDLVRMRSENNKHVLQLGDDRMAFNLLEGGKDYPGFDKLLDETLRHLETYRSIYEPSGIRWATIHYADVITIPVGGTAIEIEDYFRIVRNLPEKPFGLTGAISVEYATHAPFDGEQLLIGLARVPSGTPESIRFRLDWEKQCSTDNRLDEPILRAVLSKNHEFLVECFSEALTDQTIKLFDPITNEP